MAVSDTPAAALREAMRSVRRHKGKSLLFFAAVMICTVALTTLASKEYRSTGKLFVRLGRENATLDPTATLGPTPIVAVPQSRDNEINSVVEILQSRTLLEKVVDDLGPAFILNAGNRSSESDATADDQAAPGLVQQAGVQIGAVFAEAKGLLTSFGSGNGLDDRQRAILQLAKGVKVEAAKKSSVIDIAYEGATPEQCQAVVAKLIDAYLDEHLRLNRSRGSHQFFADQTQRLRGELSQREKQLRDLKNATGLASPDAQRQLLVGRIGRIEDELLHAESAQAVAEARVRDLNRRLTSLPESQVTAETSGFGNEGTDKMRDQFYALQVREREAAAKYTEDHPKMRQIRDQSAASRALLDGEARDRKQVTKAPNHLYQQAESALLAEGPTLAALQANARQLQSQLAATRKELTSLNDNELQVASLQREISLIEADYRKYSANLEQARIDQQLEAQRMSNIAVAQPASFEPRPIRPRKMINLLLGMCVGVLGALAIPVSLDWLGAAPQSETLHPQPMPPVLARVPRVRSGQMARRERRAVPR